MDTEKSPGVGRISSVFGRAVKDFCLGCCAFIPLAVFAFIFYYLLAIAEHIGSMLFGVTHSVTTSIVIGILIVFLLVYTGRKLRRKEKWLLNIAEYGISKIPVVGGWYSAFKGLVGTFTRMDGERGYLGTAKVPCGDGYIIGFVTKKETAQDGSATATVFVPTSPNPTTGLVFFFPEEKIEYLDITPEKAFTRIISLGTKS